MELQPAQQLRRQQQSSVAKDFVLIWSSMHLMYDFLGKWDSFEGCPQPLHKWLLTSYVLLCASRLLIIAMSLTSGSSAVDVLINLRHKSTTLRMMATAMWWALTPVLVVWSVVGSVLTWRVMRTAPHYMPSGLHLCFLVIWQVLSYAWVGAYAYVGAMAWRLERHLRQAERNLRELQDDDALQRWGRLDGFLPTASGGAGAAHLAPAQIRALAGARKLAPGDAAEDQDCPICLQSFRPGDVVRQLGACGHIFHRPCVDLWLLRAAECPLCKTRVEVVPAATA